MTYSIGDLFRVTNPHICGTQWAGIAILASCHMYKVVAISLFDSNKNAILGVRYSQNAVRVEDMYNITEDELRKIFDCYYDYELITENISIEFRRNR